MKACNIGSGGISTRGRATCQKGCAMSSPHCMRVAGFLSSSRMMRSPNSGLAEGMGAGSLCSMSCARAHTGACNNQAGSQKGPARAQASALGPPSARGRGGNRGAAVQAGA
eukprot:96848-Chlamydomonas_euryale.AAC.1